MLRWSSIFLIGIAPYATSTAAQEAVPPHPDTASRQPQAAEALRSRAPRGSEFLIPTASFVLPGLGQYVHRAPAAGLAYTSVAVAGIVLSNVGDATADLGDELPRRGKDQLGDQALHTAITAAGLSSWDAFHRAVPALQRQGRYDFLERRETIGELLSAPFDTRFLRRWTTWADLAQTALVTVLLVSDRTGDGGPYVPFRGNDAAYTMSLSMNAAVGEEALFRGWLLPAFYQRTGQRFWLANGMQATLFGAAHLPDADWYAGVIAGWAAWTGWVTKRNDWSIRESIFHHFWYDVAIVAAVMATERRNTEVRISFPTIAF